MTENAKTHIQASFASWLRSEGEMANRIRAYDWSKTPLGPVDTWSPALRTTLRNMLANRFPHILWWGPEFIQFYNDAYVPITGEKHPHRSFALPGRAGWSEIWDVIGPLVETPFKGGAATWDEDIVLEINRRGFFEESHFTIAYSPVPDDAAPGGIGGVLGTIHEITGKVIAERRAAALRDLGSGALAARSASEACAKALATLTAHGRDVPFALLYLIDPGGKEARFANGTEGLTEGEPLSPRAIALGSTLPWPLDDAVRLHQPILVDDLQVRFGSAVPPGPWSEPPRFAAVVPLFSANAGQCDGFLIAGISARLNYDGAYQSFLELLGSHIAIAIANTRAYEQERQRAEALAEIDRAKTLFFSNVSHEFRTPLTLMLAPLQDALANERLPEEERERLETAHRNSLRLLKLVNALLDFSRIEAGRVEASYEPSDLSRLTTDIASSFRSVCERAGLELIVDCPPLPETIFVDRDMWEKILLNLLSNAFKFTFAGSITLRLRAAENEVELTVTDTGVGIPESELPRLFERFHRIEGQKSRTFEGSGIGLALVQELVRLHGGHVSAVSRVDEGTSFAITLPFGDAHLRKDRIRAPSGRISSLYSEAYVEEALHWLAGLPRPANLFSRIAPRDNAGGLRGSRILIADDNADMLNYLRALLEPLCQISTVSNGDEALACIREQVPDLLLADVMMPGLDGFALLRAIRADPQLSPLPVVLLSARAGEESRIEGLNAGANDYLVKPFGARELMARVAAALGTAKLRQQAETDLRGMTLIHEAGLHCVRAGNTFEGCLQKILDAAITITGADKGTFQLFEPGKDTLVIAAQRGFEEPFLNFFAEVRGGEASACGTALKKSERIVVEDAANNAIFMGTPALAVLSTAGVRAMQSTLLVSSTGKTLGILTTHYLQPQKPKARQLRILDLLARQAADYLERKQTERTQELLLAELNHRVKNTLATVQAIAQHTLRRSKDSVEFAASFNGRVAAMARIHTMLSDTSWKGADLKTIIRDQLQLGPIDESRLTTWGPSVHLEPHIAQQLALVLYELGTNSIKYGALSASKGWVTVHWTVEGSAVKLHWEEHGGPAIEAPISKGFGTVFIENTIKGLGGEVHQMINANGMGWTLTVPLPVLAAKNDSPLAFTTVDRGDSERGAAFSGNLAGKRVLIVEDEPLIAMSAQAGLEDQGAVPAGPAASVDAALKYIATEKLDAALVDANLHGKPADNVAAALTRANIPFVFMSGYGPSSLPQAFQKAPLLAKPFSPEQVADAIAKVLQSRQRTTILRN